jgi:hypothetical protein
MACHAGKDVYREKSLSLSIAEGRKMVAAARKHHRVIQTGSQQRSGAHYSQAVKLIQDGGIGEAYRIHAGMQRNIFPGLKPTALQSGHRSAVMCHLGNISTRLGRSLQWDAAKEQVVGDPEANHWLMRGSCARVALPGV